jgi:hypothetical protein
MNKIYPDDRNGKLLDNYTNLVEVQSGGFAYSGHI